MFKAVNIWHIYLISDLNNQYIIISSSGWEYCEGKLHFDNDARKTDRRTCHIIGKEENN